MQISLFPRKLASKLILQAAYFQLASNYQKSHSIRSQLPYRDATFPRRLLPKKSVSQEGHFERTKLHKDTVSSEPRFPIKLRRTPAYRETKKMMTASYDIIKLFKKDHCSRSKFLKKTVSQKLSFLVLPRKTACRETLRIKHSETATFQADAFPRINF